MTERKQFKTSAEPTEKRFKRYDWDGKETEHGALVFFHDVLEALAIVESTTTPSAENRPAQDDVRDDLESLLDDVTAIDTWYRGSPSYEHDAGWFKDRVVRLIEERIDAIASQSAKEPR